MKGFMKFIREQGVVGLAVGFITGGAVSKLVDSFVTDIINPIIGLGMGSAEGLNGAGVQIGDAILTWGHFVNVLIDFVIILAVVYFIFKFLKLDKLDKKKEE